MWKNAITTSKNGNGVISPSCGDLDIVIKNFEGLYFHNCRHK